MKYACYIIPFKGYHITCRPTLLADGMGTTLKIGYKVHMACQRPMLDRFILISVEIKFCHRFVSRPMKNFTIYQSTTTLSHQCCQDIITDNTPSGFEPETHDSFRLTCIARPEKASPSVHVSNTNCQLGSPPGGNPTSH